MIDTNNFVTNEQKIKIVTNRLSQFAEEAYQYQLNLKTAEALKALEQVEKIKESLLALESAIRVHQEELRAITSKD